MLLKNIKKSIFVLCLSYSVFSQGQNFTGIKNWKYLPLEESFWIQFEDSLKNQNWSRISSLTESQLKKTKGSSKQGEALLAIVETCLALNLKSCAYSYSLRINKEYPGSMPSLKALVHLETLLRENNYFEIPVKDQINQGSFQEVPESLVSFLNYYVFRYNLNKNLKSWIRNPFSSLDPSNYWAQKFYFELLLERLKRGSLAETLPEFELFYQKLPENHSLKSTASLILARLKFENLEYQEAIRYYDIAQPRFREEARLILERSWTFYWLRDYARVLGGIHTIKAPHYAREISPETYLLEMLTLRSLCHYSSMRETYKEFNRRYQKTIQTIRLQNTLTNDENLSLLALQNRYIQKFAETIHDLRKNQSDLGGIHSDKFNNFIKNLILSELSGTEKQYRNEIEFHIRKILIEQSESLIKISEQMQLLDYLAGLDQNNIQKTYDEKSYQSQEIPKSNFSTLFWPVKFEYWRDEIKNYRVLITDNCEGTL